MSERWSSCKVAVVQAAPVIMDRDATIAKVIVLVREAAAAGAELVLFPEAFIPAYPRGLTFGVAVGSRSEAGRAAFARYAENAIEVPSAETDALARVAAECGVHLAIGVVERDRTTGATLYCTMLVFDATGRLLGAHRKLKPTAAERYIWGEGDGSTLVVHDTQVGRIGGLICWENYMPLARAALYRQGIEIYLAPTADARDSWQATLQHIAVESRCFVLAANQYVTRSMYPRDLPGVEALNALPEELCRGGSAIVSPMGSYLAGPLFGREGVLYADIARTALVEARFDFDAAGHYARDDVFDLRVDKTVHRPR
jgi:nitrilase